MITVVMPFYNESASLGPLLERTFATFTRCGRCDYEILIVDNGSTPAEHDALRAYANHPQVRILVLSRNFGYQGALWAGLDYAQGDPVIFMDADGEDPPEVIEVFLRLWSEGYDVVYGVRQTRNVSWVMDVSYRIFYRLLAKFAQIPIPLDAGECSLVAGRALRALRSFRDRTRMLRILRAWVGFRQVGVPYHRQARIAGRSKFNLFSAMSFAWDGFVAATDIPVKICIYASVCCFSAGLVGVIYYLFWYFVAQTKIPGFASLNITILLLFAMLFFCFSVLARYVMTLLNETRLRPPYLVAGEVNAGVNALSPPDQRHSAPVGQSPSGESQV